MSTGIIEAIESGCFYHTCDTREGSSGSPIINNSKQIIGIHIGFDKELNMNIGSFIGQIINKIKFNKDDNKQNLINEIRNKDEEEESVISNIKNYDLDDEDPIQKKIENVPSNPGNS
jgi:V8-like Glu-specific endopeptidase